MGKTFSMDVAARILTGLSETSKFNHLTDVRTLLHFAGTSTLPLTIEDNESSRKVRTKLSSAQLSLYFVSGRNISCSKL